MKARLRLFVLSAAGLLCAPAPAGAQTDSVTIVPAERYGAGWLQETFLGSRYRRLWTTPITVPVLDLETYGGGLTPVRTGGFLQTQSLRLIGRDGREYNFRSVDKELTPAMPEFTRETFVDWIRQDQTSAQMPAGPIVASALLDAVGVLNPGPQLMVLPDHPALGEFRDQFAGMLGTLEVHPEEGPNDEPFFAGAERVAGTDRLLEHLEEDLDHRVDSRSFLKARLMDVYIGDYDRHAGQWRWARYERDGLFWWVAVPEDRDYAFVAYDGLFLDLAREAGIARLVRFEDDYPDLLGMVDNSLDLTRHLVADLEWDDWQSVTAEILDGLTDDAIRDAVRTLPPSHHAIVGDELVRELLERRDRLPTMAREFYELISEVVEVHGTDAEDRVEIDRFEEGGLRVRLFADGAEPPRFDRTLDPNVTREVRVYLEGDDDEAIVRGAGGGILVHVIGGGSDDTLIDQSAGPTYFYDDRGDNEFVRGRRTFVDERSWPPGAAPDEDEAEPEEAAPAAPEDDDEPVDAEDPEEDADELIPGLDRDWGRSGTWLAVVARWESHAELVLGAGPRLTNFGFRVIPYESRVWARALFAPIPLRGGVEAGAVFRERGSTSRFDLRGRASNLEATVFHGFGNQSPGGESRDLRVWREQARLSASLYLMDTDRLAIRFGPRVEYIAPEETPGVFPPVPTEDSEALARAGVEAALELDSRDDRVFPRSGLVVQADGSAYPSWGDARGRFARVEVGGSLFAPLPVGVLAVRAGGRGAFGDFPYYDAVFLGGSETLRGHHFQRFAGDRAAYGGASLRVPIAPATILVHGMLGASVFGDAGRVWIDGASPGGWHTAVGASLWFQVPVGAVSLSYARGEENRLYFRFGLPF